MTSCFKKPLQFSKLGSKQILANFEGGRITSDTGVLLLREIEKRTGLIQDLSYEIPDYCDPSKIDFRRDLQHATSPSFTLDDFMQHLSTHL